MRKHGHEVTMLSLTPRRDDSQDYDSWVCVRTHSGKLSPVHTALAIRKKVKELRPDIVHGHYLTGGGWYGSMSGAKHKVVSAWGSDLYADSKDFLKRQCIRFARKHSNVVFADSDHLVNECRKLAPKADVRKVIFGIDTELFKSNPIKHDKFRFFSIRATAPIYNPRVIVEAFLRAHLDAELWMYRPGAEAFEIMDMVNGNEYLKSHVVWLDKRPYDRMPEIYNSCDVALSAPQWDSSSTALNEALSCGLLVVASDIPQNREWIVDGKNGFLASSFTLPDVMSKASQLHMDTVVSMGRNARQTIVEKADFEKEMRKAEGIYEELIV